MKGTLFQQLRKFRAESAKATASRNLQQLDTSDINPRSSFTRKRRLDDQNFSFYEQASSQRFCDKERYEQEITYLKNTIHSLDSENIKLKTRIHQLEDNQLKQEKILVELERIGPPKIHLLKTLNSTTTINALKKEITNIKSELSKKEAELTQMKKNHRFTQINELQIERTAFQEETIRLRQQLESLFSVSLYNLQQANIEQGVQDRIFQLVGQLQQNVITQREMEKVIERLKKECLRYRSQQIEQEFKCKKEIKKLLDQLKEDANAMKEAKETQQVQTRQDELQILTDLMFAKQEIQGKSNEIEKLNQIILELETQIKELVSIQKSETQEAVPQSQRLDLSTKSKQTKLQPPLAFATEIMDEIQLPIKKSIAIQEQIKEVKKKEPPRRKIIPVKHDDIRNICDTLKYRLMAMDIDLNSLDTYLFNEEDSLTFKELKEKLRLYPFNLTNEESQLLTRYIMEADNDIYELPEDSKNYTPYIRSVIRRVLNNYKLEIVKQQMLRSEKLKDVLTRFKPFILSNIKQLYGKECIRVTKQQFNEALISLNIELNAFEFDYLIVQGILESKGIDALNYEEMLKYGVQEQQDQQISFLLTEINNQQNQKVEMSVIEECPEKLSEIELQEQQQQEVIQKQQKDESKQYMTFDKYVTEQFESDSEQSKQEILTSAFNLEQ